MQILIINARTNMSMYLFLVDYTLMALIVFNTLKIDTFVWFQFVKWESTSTATPFV